MMKTLESFAQYDVRLVSVGICSNNEPECMTWNRARVVMNTSIGDLCPHASLAQNQEYLIVCCLFSREEYNRQKDRLETVIEEMGKWMPPQHNRTGTWSELVKEAKKRLS
jgi:hypothetical protein